MRYTQTVMEHGNPSFHVSNGWYESRKHVIQKDSPACQTSCEIMVLLHEIFYTCLASMSQS